jgi:hypothetical protein
MYEACWDFAWQSQGSPRALHQLNKEFEKVKEFYKESKFTRRYGHVTTRRAFYDMHLDTSTSGVLKHYGWGLLAAIYENEIGTGEVRFEFDSNAHLQLIFGQDFIRTNKDGRVADEGIEFEY